MGNMTETLDRSSELYNTPLELGIRALIVLTAVRKKDSSTPNFDLNRLIIYDYLLVHSGDVNGPSSIHPATPYRSGELLVKADVLRKGLNLMKSKQLVDINFESSGITYSASGLAALFLNYFDSSYYLNLKKVAEWLALNYSSYSDEELNHLIKNNMGVWGSEFKHESLFINI